ncbi:hypothetical protein [uncultured Thiohalocapsa sp.]|uniref:hypothetical protein n=1 Tax=uncultured Thiohalocapsa sp. TaxID=768990 RepID=UPI0025EDF319|nr:hypothetical protein [uncultured Thiohalocapsa sp.]
MRKTSLAKLSLPAAALLPAALLAAGPNAVPEDCRFDAAAAQGATATMACYAALDTNGDGSLSQQEAQVLPRLDGRFDTLDADGSGLLSPDEFQGGVHSPSQRGGGKGV